MEIFGEDVAAWAAGASATPTRGSRWSGNARALLTLPPCTQARDLFVTQLAEMTAYRHVHRAEHRHELLAGNAELPCQLIHSKLDQTLLLWSLLISTTFRDPHNSFREIAINHSYRRRGVSTRGRPQRCR